MDGATLHGLLACPGCHGRLVAGASALACTGCARAYPLEAGVPVFLDAAERARVASQREAWGGERVTTPENARRLALLRRVLPPPAPFLNLVSGRNLARLGRDLASAGRDPLILDLGAGEGQGAGLGRLDERLRRERTVHLDVDRFPGVDVVAAGARLPFPGDAFDAVLLKAVLEHVPDAAGVVAEAHRTLRPGGTLYVEVPFLFEYHPNPGDYLRFTRAGLEQALARFEAIEVGALVGPWAAAASLLAQALSLALSFRSRLLRKGLLPWLTWLTWPVSLPDLWTIRHPGAHFAAHHLYAFARKPAHAAQRW